MNNFIFKNKRLLNSKESAQYLGIAVQTFYNMINQRKIPFIVKPYSDNNRFWRCDIKDLDNMIENNKTSN